MAGPLTITDLENGKLDLQTIEEVTNGTPDESPVTSRLGQDIKTLAKAIQDLGFSGVEPWAPSTVYSDFTKLYTYSGSTYVLITAHTSGAAFDAIYWEVYVPGTALGTAASADLTTSATDTTAGRALKVGDFGVGIDSLSSAPAISNFDTNLTSGLYRTGGGEAGTPQSSIIGSVINLRRSDNSGVSQIYVRGDQNTGIVTMYVRGGGPDGVFTPWREFYHTGNLNTLEFGADGLEDLIGFGIATSPTNLSVRLPINLFSNPGSVTVAGTFKITDGTNTTFGTGIGSGGIGLSGLRSHRFMVLNVAGSGLTVNAVYDLRAESSTSKITVNL